MVVGFVVALAGCALAIVARARLVRRRGLGRIRFMPTRRRGQPIQPRVSTDVDWSETVLLLLGIFMLIFGANQIIEARSGWRWPLLGVLFFLYIGGLMGYTYLHNRRAAQLR